MEQGTSRPSPHKLPRTLDGIKDGEELKGYTIHALAAGGGVLALSPMPGRLGTYAADLQDLQNWGPRLVVSLCESAEMARGGAGSLERDLETGGIAVLRFAIPDYGSPDGSASAAWTCISAAVRERLAQGERVLIHCFGGCGRSGMVVLRLLIEAGEDGGAALLRLRQARPCAIETPAQLD